MLSAAPRSAAPLSRGPAQTPTTWQTPASSSSPKVSDDGKKLEVENLAGNDSLVRILRKIT